ncbi:hypothetical protein PFNF54_03678 [Plasmodium falciparum NF54]|uniref:Uncharacterized protein n=1 Tax=Plasmodium falciparum (isolate NF54) TaxID=5843 RepID=W7K2J4_PLAFO|nr:hypothetical protein PFNF54_03678 [Plasmodium falciparum NF54]
MKLKSYYFYIDIILLIFILYLKRCCKGYVLNVNVVDKDDLFVFLYKNEHLLASSYYNLKPSYFFSFDEAFAYLFIFIAINFTSTFLSDIGQYLKEDARNCNIYYIFASIFRKFPNSSNMKPIQI